MHLSMFLFMCSYNAHCIYYGPVCMSRVNMRLVSPELLLLFIIASICSLYLVWNVVPVCPIYFSVWSRHFIW
jgi:uncharacterized membrane protein YhhN